MTTTQPSRTLTPAAAATAGAAAETPQLSNCQIAVRSFDHRLPPEFFGAALHHFDTSAINDGIRAHINAHLPAGVELRDDLQLWADLTMVRVACRLDLDALVASCDWDALLTQHHHRADTPGADHEPR